MSLNNRLLNLLGFLGCIAGLLFALYLQHFKGYEPCPFCIFQRVAMLAAGLVFLAGAIHGPKAWGQWVYALLATLAAMVGAGIAARHVWLQSLPPDQVPACGPTLDYLLDMMPLQEVVTTVLKGEGSCAKIDAQWLGISLPGWTLIAFFGFAIYAVLTPVLPKFLRKSA
ncbi:MAG TPA: disulfide bond formation protein B [Solimonas sp.]|nr:disulfide bond formation protein B [Solimonas sp.]